LPPRPPHQPPPPTPPYNEGYYKVGMPSKYRYEIAQGYKEENYLRERGYPRYEEYLDYSCNEPIERVTKEDGDLYKRLKEVEKINIYAR